jgi:putative DNA primase/helicase
LQLWSEAVSARGTLGEQYLKSRQLALPDQHEEVLRFHPSCPFGKGLRLPCMVALYRDITTNEPKAIHRTVCARRIMVSKRTARAPGEQRSGR